MALRPQWVLFGDSITQRGFAPGGWVAALAEAWQRRVDVVARGYSGYNSRQALALAPRVFPLPGAAAGAAPPPQLAAIFFGANDAALPGGPSAAQHVPLAEYAANVEAIAARARAAGVAHVFLITPPPVWEPGRIAHALKAYGVRLEAAERTNAAAKQYRDACAATGARLGLPVVDAWAALQAARADWGEALLDDGLHLSPAGNAALAAAVRAGVEAAAPHLAPARMPADAPEWTELPGGAPGEALEAWYAARGA